MSFLQKMASQDNATFDDIGSSSDDILTLCQSYLLSTKNKNVTNRDDLSNDVDENVPPNCDEFSTTYNSLNMVRYLIT